jgi:hypothetical protein
MRGAKIFDLTDPNGKRSEVVEVLLSDGQISTIKIVNASSYTNLLDVSVKLGQALSRGFKHGHIRKGENLGRMFALGHNWKTGRMYSTCKGSTTAELNLSLLRDLNQFGEDFVLAEFPEEHMEIISAEMEQGRKPVLSATMGSTYIFSINAADACHLEPRNGSKNIGLWTESTPAGAEHWYLVFPYVSYRGSRGVAIKLTHGMAVSWDPRKIYHCTSLPTCPDGHEVYGGVWGSFGATMGTNGDE